MKKIRNGVFETNSSSTHCLVIEKRKNFDFVLDEGILYLSKLKPLWILTEEEYGEDILVCSDFYSKLASVLAMFNSYIEEESLIECISYVQEKYPQIKKIELDYEIYVDDIYNTSDSTYFTVEFDHTYDLLSPLRPVGKLKELLKVCEDETIDLVYKITKW